LSLEALIFDVDGTLADTEEQHRLAFNGAFAACGLPYEWSRDLYRELLRVAGGKERMAAFFTRAGAAELVSRVPEIHAEKTRRYTAAVAAGAVRLRPGVAELVAAARDRGLRLAIASTTSTASVAALLAAVWGARHPFAAIAAGDDVAHKKPAPDVYQLALARLSAAPGACIAFEDSWMGLRAATAAGLWTVITPTYWTEGDDFTEAKLVLPSLEGVTLETLRGR
jgi:HAD superfamily hydrolase (TIGR01509 family)